MSELAQGRLSNATAIFEAALTTAIEDSSPNSAPTAIAAACLAEALYEAGRLERARGAARPLPADDHPSGDPRRRDPRARPPHPHRLPRARLRRGVRRDPPAQAARLRARPVAGGRDRLGRALAARPAARATWRRPTATCRWPRRTARTRRSGTRAARPCAPGCSPPKGSRPTRSSCSTPSSALSTPRHAGGRRSSSAIVRATVLKAAGRTTEALRRARRTASRRPAASRYVRVLVDEGPRLAALLRELLARRTRRRGVPRVHRLGARAARRRAARRRAEPDEQLEERLSGRELEVLGHIADGLSNQAIADELVALAADGQVARAQHPRQAGGQEPHGGRREGASEQSAHAVIGRQAHPTQAQPVNPTRQVTTTSPYPRLSIKDERTLAFTAGQRHCRDRARARSSVLMWSSLPPRRCPIWTQLT